MAHFDDLGGFSYFPEDADLGFKPVGWLENGHEYARGEVGPDFVEKLLVLLQAPWMPLQQPGTHPCSFCRFSGGNGQVACTFGSPPSRSYHISGVSSGVLLVPSEDKLFVSPTSIAHYIDAHGYCPPVEFRRAVADCPPMRSPEYFRAVLRTPAKEWLRRLGVTDRVAEEGSDVT